MQDYTYSVFSLVAIAIHLIININLLVGRGVATVRGMRYRGFLTGILAYYISDAAWGILAGLGWTTALYVETVFFFLSLVVFVVMWCRFVVSYLSLDKWPARILFWCGCLLLLFNIVVLAANPFTDWVYYFDATGVYRTGFLRDPSFYLLIAYNAMIAAFVLAKAVSSEDTVRRRSMMVFLSCAVVIVSMILQIVWPLTPFTALGCLICNCFFHVFVIQDEQSAKHMAEIEEALARARNAEKSRSMFFSIVSHDIRTPLNAILGYSELLQNGVNSQKERDEALESIRASGATLLQLVNDVLDLAKIDAGKMTLQLEPVRLSQLTENVFASFRMVAKQKHIELVNRTADVPILMVDEHRFRQFLFNLVGNAVKFTENGSVTVEASYVGTNLEVSVSDTGCGIPKDMLTRILDPFVQVRDRTHSFDKSEGTGLGLSICRRLVEMMSGELVVKSEIGKGSTFSARIPGVARGEEKHEPVPAPNPVDVLTKLPRHVLVVDDSPVNRAVLTAHLKRAGVISVNVACDGGEALAALDSAAKDGNPYDFVFTDFWMPNINGLELIEKVRADSRFASLPVFAVTADIESKNDSRSSLFSGILFKPLTYAKLVDAFAVLNGA